VTELLVPDEVFRDAVLQKKPTRTLQDTAIQQGMQTMWQNGLRMVLKGQTTLEEMLRVSEEYFRALIENALDVVIIASGSAT
jgi:general secretion pathway protein E